MSFCRVGLGFILHDIAERLELFDGATIDVGVSNPLKPVTDSLDTITALLWFALPTLIAATALITWLARGEASGDPARSALRINAAQVERLEAEIDAVNANLAELTSFVLPGGTPAAAYLHLARTVSRRAERDMTALAMAETVNPEAVRYINRLSDLLFVLARHANDDGTQDVLWVPGANR